MGFRQSDRRFLLRELAAANVASTGKMWFVHSGTGANTKNGRTPSSAFATIDYAVGQCTAAKNDIIVVMPGHTETVTAAAGLALDVSGVSVIGIGNGRNRPVINYTTAAAASVDVTAANVRISNIAFTLTGVDAVTAGINVSAADFRLDNCEIFTGNATNQAALALLTAAGADRMVIEDNYIHGTSDAGTAAAIRIAAGDDCIVRRNTIFGAYTTSLGGIDNSAAVAGLQIDSNRIVNITASSTKAIVAHGSTTGHVTNNRLGILSGTAPVTAAAMYMGGNAYVAAVGVTAGTALTW